MAFALSSPSRLRTLRACAAAALLPLALSACSTISPSEDAPYPPISAMKAADGKRLRANCELPGKVRKIGSRTVIAARQRVVAAKHDCESRGGDMLAIAD